MWFSFLWESGFSANLTDSNSAALSKQDHNISQYPEKLFASQIVQCTTQLAFHSSPASKCPISSTNTSWMSAFCSAPGSPRICKVFACRDLLNMCFINWLCITLSFLSWSFLVSHILPQWKRLCFLETSPSLRNPPNSLQYPHLYSCLHYWWEQRQIPSTSQSNWAR